jgi:hypothetical protein
LEEEQGDTKLTHLVYSGAHKEEQAQKLDADQVQGPMPSPPLHARHQRFGSSREAQAESTTQYVAPVTPVACDREVDTKKLIVRPGLSISETPKKNAKGKRVAKS